MTVYELSQSHYEDYYRLLFLGPEGENWESICDSVWNEAALNCIKANGRTPAQVEADIGDEVHPTFIGVSDIVDHMVPLLEARGFERVRPIRKDYWGGGIIRDANDEGLPFTPEALGRVEDHNQKIEDALHK